MKNGPPWKNGLSRRVENDKAKGKNG